MRRRANRSGQGEDESLGRCLRWRRNRFKRLFGDSACDVRRPLERLIEEKPEGDNYERGKGLMERRK
uniref:Uncharacterized protein n=1 Tax=Oryza glumipatula TaxID=40148 RepID=A0A0E0A0R4_9ORYZ